MANKQTAFVHFENNSVVGVSTNPRIALSFVTAGENRSVKEFQIENMKRGRNGLVQKRGRKVGSIKKKAKVGRLRKTEK